MGRGKPPTAGAKAKKPKTLIQLKRESRKTKALLPKAPRPTPTPAKPRDPDVPKVVRPKPKPQNPGFQKWMALFTREITMIETHLKHCEQFRQHWRAEINKMDGEMKEKWETGEVGNWVRLLEMMERTREILAQAREANAWIVPKKNLGLGKNLPGMKDFVLGAEKAKVNGKNGKAGEDDAADSMDTREEDGDSLSAGVDFIPLIAKKKRNASEDAAEKDEVKAATESVAPNPFFMVDTEPTPIDLNTLSKKSKKRAKEEENEFKRASKRTKKDKKNSIVVPQFEHEQEQEPEPASTPKSKSVNVDFSAIETQLQSEIEAGTKAKEEREKAKAEAKLAKKEKKRKRLSEGDSEKEVKKVKKDKEKKEKKRKADVVSDEEVLSDEDGKKKRRAAA